ncbi:MAG TPA: M14 family metallopeptidase [Bacillota bacterium]|nr:M14 family metallopeptidase [Bacillota bacterium]
MNKKTLPELDRIVKQEGNLTQGFIDVAGKPDGSHVSIPVVMIKGEQEGPVFLADACNHGDEYEGTEAIIRFAQNYSGGSFRGTFVGVLAVNFDAFVANTRVSTIDHANMNRLYPGNPDLFISNRVAHVYMERIIKNVDYIISFHGGGVELHLDPIVGYQPSDDPVGTMSRKMAEAFGVTLLWRMQNLPFDGVSTIEAAKFGIPGIIPEMDPIVEGSMTGRRMSIPATRAS